MVLASTANTVRIGCAEPSPNPVLRTHHPAAEAKPMINKAKYKTHRGRMLIQCA